MRTHADKTQENNRNLLTDPFPGQQKNNVSAFQSLDKQDAVTQDEQQVVVGDSPYAQQFKAYQAMVDNSPQVQQMKAYQAMADNSPQVQQMKAYQEMADNSPRVQQMKAYQAMADKYTVGTVQHKATLEKEDNLEPLQKKENNTGLPDNLKAGIENLSGISMDDVNVNYNSAKPAGLQAHAYAQGTDIHIAPGQEKHLPHEAWHVVQQKQGRVKPTVQMKGQSINDDAVLEKEADVMGAKANRGNFGREENILQKKASITLGHSEKTIQANGTSWLDTITKGAGIYLGLTLKDEGSAYAKALMRHYVMGGGSEFNPETSTVNYPTDAMWSSFMISRPEIQRAMFNKFSSMALHYGSDEDKKDTFNVSITGVKLNQLESMRWTLHGCHKIDISGSVEIKTEGTSKKILFSNVKFAWIDVGDMHPGTKTEMDNGEMVDDAEFTGAGSSYPIYIPFYMSGASTWKLNNNVLTKISGWPDTISGSSSANRE